MEQIVDPFVKISTVQTSKALVERQITHGIKGKVAEPIADVELTPFTCQSAHVIDEFGRVLLDNRFLFH